jgi:very-short-patch-repair endonuclease
MTDAERILWRQLRLRQVDGHKFRRQHPIGEYIVDFLCLEKRLAIEVDGGQHAESVTDDEGRGAWLKAQGYTILRFWSNQVITEMQAVMEVIREALLKR